MNLNMNKNATKTLANLEKYLAKTGRRMYTKIAGTSNGAVWEGDGYVAMLRLTNLTREINCALFEIFPGVSLSNRAFFPLVSSYIQEHAQNDAGYMQVSYRHADVYYAISLPIAENALSQETFELVESSCKKMFAEHRENLDALAHGIMPKALPAKVEKAAVVCNKEMALWKGYNETIGALYDYMCNHSGHNAVCEGENIHGLPSWESQIYLRDHHFFLKVDVLPSGLAMFKVSLGPKGILVPAAYRRMLGDALDHDNADRKVGNVWVGDDEEGFCAIAYASLLDGPIGKKTIDMIEGVLCSILMKNGNRYELLAHGIVPDTDDDDEVDIMSRMAQLRKMMENDDDEEDTSEDASDSDLSGLLGSLGDDISALLGSLRPVGVDSEEE